MDYTEKKEPPVKMTYEELLEDRDYYLEEMRIARKHLVVQDLILDDLQISFGKIPGWVKKIFGA